LNTQAESGVATRQAGTTFTEFVIEEQRRNTHADPELTTLLGDLEAACKRIGVAVSRGALSSDDAGVSVNVNVQGETQKPLDIIANEIMLKECARGGALRGMVSEELEEPSIIPEEYRRGRYLLAFDPLDGSSNLDVNVTVGTIFSVLRAPRDVAIPEVEDFLQTGLRQVAAGYALHGPSSMIVMTMGRGVNGFTLDRETGAYTLTHPEMCVPEETREFAINASNERFWEAPVLHYVNECIQGKTGPRGEDFNMRWIASMVAEVHRILIRGGMFMYPRDTKDPSKAGRLRLLYEGNPMAMIVEQAGGLATTGRERLLDLIPTSLHERVPVILGSRREVERLIEYHAAFDRGEDLVFESPLFNPRSVFRSS